MPRRTRPASTFQFDGPFDHPFDRRFDRPLTLENNVIVRTLDDAAAFVRSYTNTRLPKTRISVLRWLERAANEEQLSKAANMFRFWAISEGILREDE
jgi:hypothetical protein